MLINSKSVKFYTFVLEFTAGLMISIVCFELLPEAMNISNVTTALLGFLLGAMIMVVVDGWLYRKNKSLNKDYLLGLMIFLSISIHNFPEGLAIGAGYDVSNELGISIFLAILLHDIPEGISMILPMKKDKDIKKYMLVLYPFISGIPTAIGAGIGGMLAEISNDFVGICLSFAGGVMAYVVLGDIMSESKSMYKGRLPVTGSIIGIVVGIIVAYL